MSNLRINLLSSLLQPLDLPSARTSNAFLEYCMHRQHSTFFPPNLSTATQGNIGLGRPGRAFRWQGSLRRNACMRNALGFGFGD